jgi:hypothetical protein
MFRDVIGRVPGADNRLETYNGVECSRRPDSAVFVRQASGYGQVDGIIKAIPQQFLQTTILPPDPGDPEPYAGSRDPTPTVVDSWARDEGAWELDEFGVDADPHGQRGATKVGQQTVLYVHPGNSLAQDLYGKCINGRPYFMSAGPDKRYGLTIEVPDAVTPEEKRRLAVTYMADNIYSYTPGPARTDGNFVAR